MKKIRILVFLFLVFVLIVSIQNRLLGKSKISYPKSTVYSNPASVQPTSVPTPTPFPPTLVPNSPTPIPILTSPSLPTDMSSFIYPGSAVVESDANSMTLNSLSSPQAITDWYKTKITSMGMNARSFVQTNTNGNVLNRLAGANGLSKVNIDVIKQNSQTETTIKVFLISN